MTSAVWLTGARARPVTTAQWWVLTARFVVPSVKSGEVLSSILAPAAFTASFYLPLKTVMMFASTPDSAATPSS